MTEDQKFTLYLSGGWHLTDTNKRIEGLPVDPDSIDIVFEENATHNPPSQAVIITNWVATFLICLFLKLYLICLDVASRLGLTDAGIVDTLQNAGAEVVQTDRNFHRMLASGRQYWGVLHWAFAVMVFFGSSAWVQSINPNVSILVSPVIELLPAELQAYAVWGVLILELLAWFLFAGAIMGGFFIQGTIEARNYAIMNQIENYVRSTPNGSIGCLVIGGMHVPHLKRLIEESDTVELGQE